MQPSKDIAELLKLMAALRHPETGCPWDVKQNFETIKPYTIEEAYEVADAIERDDLEDLKDELGDLLFQVVFHAQMAEEAGAFSFGDVVEAITTKMIRRHPHVFARSEVNTPEAVKLQWAQIKAAEKKDRAERRAKRGLVDLSGVGLLDDVPRHQPALSEALKLQERAATVGFDWSEAEPILDKIEEEIGELREALRGGNSSKIKDELGDLIFALVNIGRHVKTEPEQALRGTNTKFRNRFNYIELELKKLGKDAAAASLDEMEALWQAAKGFEPKQAAE